MSKLFGEAPPAPTPAAEEDGNTTTTNNTNNSYIPPPREIDPDVERRESTGWYFLHPRHMGDATEPYDAWHRVTWPVFFTDLVAEAGHAGRRPVPGEPIVPWRLQDRMKTVSVALLMCLNIGVDPPDVQPVGPRATLECWIDPLSQPLQKALETIGKQLEAQYQRWQPRAKYKQSLDPTVEDVKKLCLSLRRNTRGERVLLHYNGHGVPRPTRNGEIWVFNKQYTQYIPLSIYDLQTWMSTPSIYVFDCSAAGTVIPFFLQFADQRKREHERIIAANPDAGTGAKPPPSPHEFIIMASCAANETLPSRADLPADVFTSCLTTPIRMALRWFCKRSALTDVDADLIDRVPGRLNDRRTPLGELNWVFTAITDTIAWNALPPTLFQRLFRQDLLVASLFRNYLLAERIMRSCGVTPVSHPKLPETYRHPMWGAWDHTADLCLAQLKRMRNAEGGGSGGSGGGNSSSSAPPPPPPSTTTAAGAAATAPSSAAPNANANTAGKTAGTSNNNNNNNKGSSTANNPSAAKSSAGVPSSTGVAGKVPATTPAPNTPRAGGASGSAASGSAVEFKSAPFFAEQLTAFEVWLSFGSSNRRPPEQLPIVLQVLLSAVHRHRALVLLGRFLDLGTWAVNLALSVGIFPYVLKLLQSQSPELKGIMVFIWAKILALDASCQSDLVREGGHMYFVQVLSSEDDLGLEAEAGPDGADFRYDFLERMGSALAARQGGDTGSQLRTTQATAGQSQSQSSSTPTTAQTPAPSDRSMSGKARRGIMRDHKPRPLFAQSPMRTESESGLMGIMSPMPQRRNDPGSPAVSVLSPRDTENGDGSPDWDEAHLSERVRRLRKQGRVPHLDKAMSLFALCTIMRGHPAGQRAVLSKGLEELCLKRLVSESGLVRRWACLCLAGMWERFDESCALAVDIGAHEQLCLLLTDPLPEVRASAVLALGNLMETRGGGGPDRERVALNIGNTLVAVAIDASGLVRREMVIAFGKIMAAFAREMARIASGQPPPPPPPSPSPQLNQGNQQSQGQQSQGLNQSQNHHHPEDEALRPTLHTPSLRPHNSNNGRRRSSSVVEEETPRPKVSLFSEPIGQVPGATKPHRERKGSLPPRPRAPSGSTMSRRSTGESSSTYDNARDFHKFAGTAPPAPPPSAGSLNTSDETTPADNADAPAAAGRQQQPQAASHTQSLQSLSMSMSQSQSQATTAASNQSNQSSQAQAQAQAQAQQQQTQQQAQQPGPDPYPTLINVWFLIQALCEDPNPRVSVAARCARNYHLHLPAGSEHARVDTRAHAHPHHPLHAHLPTWSSRHFATRLSTLPNVDGTDPVAVERAFRSERMRRVASEARSVQQAAGARKLEDHIAILDSESGPLARLLFHPSMPLMVSADAGGFGIWAWERGGRIGYVGNGPAGNPHHQQYHQQSQSQGRGRRGNVVGGYVGGEGVPGANKAVAGGYGPGRITSLCLVNRDTDAMVMTGSDDGSCRIWSGCFDGDGPNPRLAAAWRAYPDLHPRLRSPGLVLDWQQVNGSLVAGGDGPTLMWWDVSRELCTQGVSTGTDSYVTSLTHNRLGGTATYVGCGDGTVLTFDHRVPDGYGPVCRLEGHQSYIVGVEVPLAGHAIFTASVDEPVLMWDIRKPSAPVAKIDWDGSGSSSKKKKRKDKGNTITSFAVHDYAPIVAVGSSQQFIKVFNMRGAKLSTIRYHDGFLGQRIGAVTCLNFHPTEVFLAAGGADSIISIYAGEGGRVRLT